MQTLLKIKRIQPLIDLKKARVDAEAATLAQVRQEKIAVVQAMKDNQRRYMQGLDELNLIRASSARINQETIESGLDHVKATWYKCYKNVQEIESKERRQISQLLTAERELAAVEKLREKYKLEFRKETGKIEQRTLDEIALRQFNSRN